MRKPATDTLLNRIKKDAKKGVSPTKTYMQALDELAMSAGYESWREIARANGGRRKATEGDDIPLDPVLPPRILTTVQTRHDPSRSSTAVGGVRSS